MSASSALIVRTGRSARRTDSDTIQPTAAVARSAIARSVPMNHPPYWVNSVMGAPTCRTRTPSGVRTSCDTT
ncbi:Uncharacterised protein [Mycobacterium tuberculosis]|nr:Uncharacterised protein [Mycobacterium tuberculosis]